MGRYYAATYVVLDAVNRARDAAADNDNDNETATAASAARFADSAGGTPAVDDRASIQQDTSLFRDGGGGGGGGYGDIGSGGLGVIVVSNDGTSLDTTGELIGGPAAGSTLEQRQPQGQKQKPQKQQPQQQEKSSKRQRKQQRQDQKQRLQQQQPQKPQKPQKPQAQAQQQDQEQQRRRRKQEEQQRQPEHGAKRAHPDTGGVLEGGDGWSASRESLGEETVLSNVSKKAEDEVGTVLPLRDCSCLRPSSWTRRRLLL